METMIAFNKHGYDPFIDFLKGVCILFIILTHCFPDYLIEYTQFDLWGRTAVPLLILLQVFHSYKKGLEASVISIRKIWSRVAWPFFLTEAVIFMLFPLVHTETAYKDLVYNVFWGGLGPGCYYPWIYMEMAIIIPLCAFIFKRFSKRWQLVTFILISQLLEVAVCLINLPEWAYRITFFKYTFLIFLGYRLASEGLKINWKTILLSLLSMACLLFFSWTNPDLRPLFTNYDIWAIFHWVCYFYMAYLFLYLLTKAYQLIARQEKVMAYIMKIGKYSYEVFLFQLFYFTIIRHYIDCLLTELPTVWADLTHIIVAVTVCVVPVVGYKSYRNRKKEN